MSGAKISSVKARRVWDSRGRPTIEAEIRLEDGKIGRAIAPAGASRGSREAVDLRDGGARLGGYGVQAALAGIREVIGPALIGMDATDQAAIDARMIELDGTPTKQRLGGNATVAVSLAALHAAATAGGVPLWRWVAELSGAAPSLPLPEIQIFGGGAHASRRVDVQDFMIMVPGAASVGEALEVTAEVYSAAGAILAERGALKGVADEGGWWPEFASNEDALDTLMLAIERAGEVPGERVVISLDVAASEFGHGGRYELALDGRSLDRDGMIEMLGGWLDRYPIVAIEDPLAEDDAEGMARFTAAYGERVEIIGDDLLVTNAGLVEASAVAGTCNALLLKVNQAGTVSEALAAWRAASSHGWSTVVSARSGETEDTSIVHVAVGLGAGQLKVGSFARSERMAKWNECIRLEETHGAEMRFVRSWPLRETWWGKQAAG
jgi:enolase